jgi:tetratricopeptide (TPR) repeat protein
MATSTVAKEWTGWSAMRLRAEASHAERARQPDRAIELLEEAIRRAPDDWKSVRHLGSLLARLGRKRPAKEHFCRLAEHYERERLPTQAIAVWKLVLSFEPDFAGCHVKLGELYALEGFRAEARKHYGEALAHYRAEGRSREAAQIEARINELDELAHPRLQVATNGTKPGPSSGKSGREAREAQGGPVAEQPAGSEDAEDRVGLDDYGMRYDLGVTYRDMGLLDEAIAELQLASRGTGQLVECASLLAACFLEKEQPLLAVKWLERALAEPDLDPRHALGLRYDLARAHEAHGDIDRAFGLYVELHGEDPGFRDVAEKVRQLGRPRSLTA